MGTWTDDSSKKTMLIQRQQNGKWKILGTYKLTPEDGEMLMATYNYRIEGGPCAIEFDEIEFVEEGALFHRGTKTGQPNLTYIEYAQ